MEKLIFVNPAISLSFSIPSIIPRSVADKSNGDLDWIVNVDSFCLETIISAITWLLVPLNSRPASI